MKGAVAIIVVLSASALLVKASYDAKKYQSLIIESLEKVTETTSRLSIDYMNLAKYFEKTSQDVAAEYALAAQLMYSVGSLRHATMAVGVEGLKGENYAHEMISATRIQHMADSQIEVKLESLLKLPLEIRRSRINGDVLEVIRGIADHRNFMHNLLKETPL